MIDIFHLCVMAQQIRFHPKWVGFSQIIRSPIDIPTQPLPFGVQYEMGFPEVSNMKPVRRSQREYLLHGKRITPVSPGLKKAKGYFYTEGTATYTLPPRKSLISNLWCKIINVLWKGKTQYLALISCIFQSTWDSAYQIKSWLHI